MSHARLQIRTVIGATYIILTRNAVHKVDCTVGCFHPLLNHLYANTQCGNVRIDYVSPCSGQGWQRTPRTTSLILTLTVRHSVFSLYTFLIRPLPSLELLAGIVASCWFLIRLGSALAYIRNKILT